MGLNCLVNIIVHCGTKGETMSKFKQSLKLLEMLVVTKGAFTQGNTRWRTKIKLMCKGGG